MSQNTCRLRLPWARFSNIFRNVEVAPSNFLVIWLNVSQIFLDCNCRNNQSRNHQPNHQGCKKFQKYRCTNCCGLGFFKDRFHLKMNLTPQFSNQHSSLSQIFNTMIGDKNIQEQRNESKNVYFQSQFSYNGSKKSSTVRNSFNCKMINVA
jgi:hypothetical protein